MNKNYIKNIISILLAINIAIFGAPKIIMAESKEYYAQYSGSTTSDWGYKPNCTFTINKIVGNRFRGTFSAQNINPYNFTQNIEGTVKRDLESFTCFFSVNFYNNKYFSIIRARVYPYEGKCECSCGGSWHLLDFEMTGTKFNINIDSNKIINSSNYNENDMISCMKLSNYIYGYKIITTKKDGSQEEEDVIASDDKKFKNIISTKDPSFIDENNFLENKIKVYNFKHLGVNDHNADNVAFAIMLRENDKKSVDVFVVIRGTYKDEWQGNTEITGTEYDASCKEHENFQKASDSIKSIIKKYVKQYCLDYDKVNLIITGHSRGAAVANLYAKEATDSINGVYNDSIPSFSSVTAYTFATPNVAKYNTSMESYNNIYNFCFKEDVVPTVPLTKPVDGGGYWKYGKTFLASLKDIKAESNILIEDFYIVDNVPKIHDCLWKWPSVDDYYNKKLYAENSTKDYTTLYDFAHNATGLMGSVNKMFNGAYKLLKNHKKYGDIYPIIGVAIPIIGSIGNAHHYNTYLTVIKITGDDYFKQVSFNDILLSLYSNYKAENDVVAVNNLPTNIILSDLNSSNVSQLTSFANQGDNLSILGWNLDDPSTWTGVTWNEDGNVESIDLSYKNLDGTLDLSNFSSLKSLNLSGNNLTSVNLDNCSSLEEFDCSFNKLTSLDLSDCTNLKSVICCYNYLDTHEGSTLYNKLDDLMFSDCYVNYYPQSVPDNATFDTTELNALKTFANTNNNNTALNWLDGSGNIDTEKLQNNVLFEYDGSKHRVVAIDISDLDVSGTLDLTSLSLLQELYCENTKVTTLNINGCTKLEILHCDNCELESLTLPSNADSKTSSLYDVSCEYNYLDINIFTENIIKYIEFKSGAVLNYKKQYINKEISAFDESDYNLLVDFANQRNNNKVLDWDLSTPGKWENVSWKFDNTSGKYKLSECHFDFMKVKGNIDVSGCDMLDEVSFSGSKINTVTISGKNLNDSTFYGCSELEAVIIKGGSTIYEGTFKMCPTLQAIYIPNNITEIADKAFENLSNITIAGVADSYAQTYANEHNINFKPGAFICGNIVAKENLDDSYQYYYPVEDVSIVYKDEVQSTSDKLGYFVLFSTESGENQYKLEYPYGYNINQTTSITNNEPLIIENPIGLICYDWRNDGCINAKDYVELLDQIKKGSEITGIDDKYFDINKDGKVTKDDWEFACNFLLYLNPNK